MLPIIINPEQQKVLLIGDGEATARRAEMLSDAGVDFEQVPSIISHQSSAKYDITFAADVEGQEAEDIYNWGKSTGSLVNVEDIKHLCDFHVPAMVRRGDLLLTISTGGSSPRVARRLRRIFQNLFNESWAERLKFIGVKRVEWKKLGAGIPELAEKTDVYLDGEGWLKEVCPCKVCVCK